MRDIVKNAFVILMDNDEYLCVNPGLSCVQDASFYTVDNFVDANMHHSINEVMNMISLYRRERTAYEQEVFGNIKKILELRIEII